MDFAQAIHELWRRRGWLAIGLLLAALAAVATIYDIRGFPPTLQEKTLSLGTSSTSLLVDTPESSVTNLEADLEPLVARAVVLSRLATSEPVRTAIAGRVGLRPDQLFVEAPIDDAIRPQAAPETRIQTILSADQVFRVAFTAQRGLPNIVIATQAPRAEDAVRLATASSDAFRDYVRDVQERQGQPERKRVLLRQLGQPSSGTIAEDVNLQVAILAFVATFVGWCLLVLLITGVRRNLGMIRAAEQVRDGSTRVQR